MTFPAWDAFDAEKGKRVKMRHVKVYRWCRVNLEFVVIGDTKLQNIADESGVHLTVVSRVLDDLVGWGYLLEYERGKYGERRFTLAWSRGTRVAQFATSTPNA